MSNVDIKMLFDIDLCFCDYLAQLWSDLKKKKKKKNILLGVASIQRHSLK